MNKELKVGRIIFLDIFLVVLFSFNIPFIFAQDYPSQSLKENEILVKFKTPKINQIDKNSF